MTRVDLLQIQAIRAQFPALHLRQSNDPKPPVFLDGPGGTQMPESVIQAMARYQWNGTANTGGAFRTSRRTDKLIDEARLAACDLVGASDPREIVFGPNMTTLTFRVAQAIGRKLAPGDEVLVTRLDHDANVAPWKSLADRGIRIVEAGLSPEDGTLDLKDLFAKLGPKTKLVAVGLASNMLGTIHPVRAIAEAARAVGAWTFVDAVHYAPHGLLSVADLGCDFLVCSAYKFFGPYLGLLWGRRELLDSLPVDKVRPADDAAPDRWETGTKDHTGLAGLVATVDYLADLADLWMDPEPPVETFPSPLFGRLGGGASDLARPHFSLLRPLGFAGREISGTMHPQRNRRDRLVRAFAGLQQHERSLSRQLLEGLTSVKGLRLFGLADPKRLDERVPTFSFTLAGHTAEAVATALAKRGIYCWAGNFYAPTALESLSPEATGGLVRVGAVHYNTKSEIDTLVAALRELAEPIGDAAAPKDPSVA